MDKKDYTCGYRVTLEEIEDSDITELTKDLKKRAEDCKVFLADQLLREVQPPQVSRFRRWLGWKLWQCAGRVNPETMNR
jgi:hypothetical protein